MVFPFCTGFINKDLNALIRYLMIKLAPVLIAEKPARFCSLYDIGPMKVPVILDAWRVYKNYVSEFLAVGFFEVFDRFNHPKVFFYKKELLEQAMMSGKVSAFLSSYGYPVYSGLENNLKHLQTRLEQPDFPHEVGIFLGYPLKDVLGFINGDIPFCIKGLWKVYAEPEYSCFLMRKYKYAEEQMRKVIGQKNITVNSMKTIKEQFELKEVI